LTVAQPRGRIAADDRELRGVDTQQVLVVDLGVDRPERGAGAVFDRELLGSTAPEKLGGRYEFPATIIIFR
jgi:hypothetical protein